MDWLRLALTSIPFACLFHPCELLADSTIYRCVVAGVSTFSDRPCGDRSTIHQPGAAAVSTYQPPAATPTDDAGRSSASRRRARERASGARADIESAARARKLEECRRIEASLREIRSRMRAGYSASEGERLRTRQSKLNGQRREKCGSE
ncbi:MAG: DUF4124 domain-containing protein [Steroidobacteraceae bacterium]|jgi:hypothetical protein|nr:DUF4124 domain-containing protein [Steroidobacteraceae bacterium]